MVKRIVYIFLILILVAATAFFIWISRGTCERADFSALSIPEPFLYFYFNADREILPGFNSIIDGFDLGFFKTAALKTFVRFNLPVQLKLTGYIKEGQSKPDFLFFAKNCRLSRLGKIFLAILETSDVKDRKWRRMYYDRNYILVNDKKIHKQKINSYSVFKDMTCLSTRPNFLRDILENYACRQTASWEKDVLGQFRWEKESDFVLSVSNRQKELSRIIKRAQDKSSFGFFPTIDDIICIGLRLESIDERGIKGHFDFIYHSDAEVEKIESDVDFLKCILQRVIYGRNLDFNADILRREQKVVLEFDICSSKK